MELCVVCLFPSVYVQLYLPSVYLFVFVLLCILFVSLFLFLEGLSQGFLICPRVALSSITILACLSELRG